MENRDKLITIDDIIKIPTPTPIASSAVNWQPVHRQDAVFGNSPLNAPLPTISPVVDLQFSFPELKNKQFVTALHPAQFG